MSDITNKQSPNTLYSILIAVIVVLFLIILAGFRLAYKSSKEAAAMAEKLQAETAEKIQKEAAIAEEIRKEKARADQIMREEAPVFEAARKTRIAAQKIQSATEVGVTYLLYRELLVNLAAEADELNRAFRATHVGEQQRDVVYFHMHISFAISAYELAARCWGSKIKNPGIEDAELDELLQSEWSRAKKETSEAMEYYSKLKY